MAELPRFDVRWREMPNGHWLVVLANGDRILWADTTPYIYRLAGESPAGERPR